MLDIISDLIIENVLPTTNSILLSKSGASGKRFDRPVWTLIIHYEGETVYKNANKSVCSNIGNAVLLPRGCSYEWRCLKTGHWTCLDFECSSSLDDIFSIPVRSSDEIISIINQIGYNLLRKKELYRIECIKDAYRILLKLSKGFDTNYIPKEKAERLSPSLDYMLKHYTENMTNDFLASLSKLSTVYFRKLFKDIYGTSPINYVRSIRIKKACEMLRRDFGSITDIALSLGYPNVYDFSRDFKKHMGTPPSKYAKADKTQ